MTLAPNASDVLLMYGYVLSRVGREEDSVPVIRNAIRLCPIPPLHYLSTLSQSCRRTGRYEEALQAAKLFVTRAPSNSFGPYLEALAYGASGRDEEGRAAIARVRALDATFDLHRARSLLAHRSSEEVERWLEVLRRLGLQ